MKIEARKRINILKIRRKNEDKVLTNLNIKTEHERDELGLKKKSSENPDMKNLVQEDICI